MTTIAETETETNWLESLKTGDEVGYKSHSNDDNPWIATVSKITPTQIVVMTPYAQEVRMDRTTGRERGNTFGRASIIPDTPELRERIERRQMASHISDTRAWFCGQMTTGEMRQVIAIMDAAKARKEKGGGAE